MRRIPETKVNSDWYRRAAQAVSSIINIVTSLQAKTDYANLADHLDDTTAAAGGVEVGELYRTGSIVKVRVS